ncbi:phospholipase D-like domain-containing protein [Geomonas agri]|uniref:phospholipase D-like domain-containing protein n=1 Tax=Geomonas agri TaxID=2873702 RepID=UPI001CD6C69A|nr:phospholipase D-like domain-containing protein [Geomonas agri]
MCRSVILVCVVFIILTIPCFSASQKTAELLVVSFPTDEGGVEAIAKEINSAKSQILVQAYSFISKPIAHALIEARKRGVRIEAVLDSSQRSAPFVSDDFVSRADIPTYTDSEHTIAISKAFIIDRNTLITGSIDFTDETGKKNADGLVIVKGNKPLVYRFLRDFEEHKRHSGKGAAFYN